MRVSRIRFRKERDKVRISTYRPAGRGGENLVGTVLLSQDEVKEAFQNEDILSKLGMGKQVLGDI